MKLQVSFELMCLESKILMGSMCGSIEQNELVLAFTFQYKGRNHLSEIS